MANIVDNPEYTPNEIYAIASTDSVEGWSAGSSFGGIGVDNYPHQQLANRTSWLYGQVNNLNSAVSAIQNKLIKSGTVTSYSINPGVNLTPNGGLAGVAYWDFTFPSSSPTGAFCLHARLQVAVSAPGGLQNVLNLGTMQLTVHDDTTNQYALNNPGYLLVSGNAGFGSAVSQDGFFVTSYYTPGQSVQVSVGVGLTTAAYGFPYLTVGETILTLTAIPF